MSKNTLILKNALFLASRTVIISLIGLFAVRELLNILGAEAYGLFNLVFGIAILFSFINGAMVSSLQRYLAYYIGKEDEKILRKIFSVSLFLHFCIGIIVLLVTLLFKNFFIYNVLTISQNYLNSAEFVYYISVMAIFISIVQSPFNALILAYEKMIFYAWMSLYEAFLKILIIYFLHYFSYNKLEVYSTLYLAASITILFIYFAYSWVNFKWYFNKVQMEFKWINEIFSYMGWNLFGNFAYTFKTQGVNILLNVFFGAIVNSSYAITNTITGVINGLISSISTAINPQIYKSYAEVNQVRNFELISMGSKYSFYFSLIVALPLILKTEFFMKLWLNNIPDYSIIFVKLSLIILLVDSLSGSLMAGIQATGNIKKYQIIVGVVVFLNLPVSYALMVFFRKPEIVFLVSLVFAFVGLYLRLYFLENIISYKKINYVINVLIPIGSVLLSSVFFGNIVTLFMDFNFGFFYDMIEILLIISFNIIFIYFLGLDKNEKIFINKKIGDLKK